LWTTSFRSENAGKHGETDGDDLYDTPLFVLATAPSSVATTGTDAFDVAPGEGVNLDDHFNGDDDGGSHDDDDTTLATIEEKEYAIALLKHHPFQNIIKKGKWKVVMQQQCNSHLQQMFEYDSKLVDLPHCFDGINRVFTTCTCLKTIQEGTIEVICDVLGKNFLFFPLYFLFIKSNVFFSFKVKFAYQPGIHQTILLERIKSGRERQATRNAYVNKYHPKNGGGAKLFFHIPLSTESNNIFELPVCLHAFRALFCMTQKISQYFRKHEASTLFGPIQHGNCNTQNRCNGSKQKQSENDLIDFLQSVSDTYGEAYATCFIGSCVDQAFERKKTLWSSRLIFQRESCTETFAFKEGIRSKVLQMGPTVIQQCMNRTLWILIYGLREQRHFQFARTVLFF
jgi:hypothetical protein